MGPISLEELQAARARGTVGAETYVIEHTGEPGVVGAWRRYQEVFPPAMATLPPVPGATPMPASPIVTPPALATAPAAHPLFPSAAHAPSSPLAPPAPAPAAPSVFPHAAPHAHYPVHRTNSWCAWGFGIGIAAFMLSIFCGLGLLLSIPGLIVCIIGLSQVNRFPDQSGKGLAIAGVVLSILGLLVSLGFLAWAIPMAMKARDAAFLQSSE